MRHLLAVLVLVTALSGCGAGPRTPTRTDPELDALFVQLAQAPDVAAATPIQDAIAAEWADSGSATINVLLERADAAANAGDTDLALGFLQQASDLDPDYAEPWSRRAGIAYRAEDYAGAIQAIQETLKREPRHFGAMAGLGLIYEELGEQRAALDAFRAALVVHPHYEVALEGVRRLEPRVDGRDA